MRWNNHADWVWSERPVHEALALVPMETFEAVQTMFGRTRQSARRTPAEGRHYLLAGIMRCGLCGRRMQGQWNHGRPYYRCKFPDDYGIDAHDHPKSVYVKEEAVLPGLDGWLAGLFDDEHLDHTCEVLAGAAEPDPDYEARQNDLDAKVRDCDRRLARYREALEHVEGEVVPIVRVDHRGSARAKAPRSPARTQCSRRQADKGAGEGPGRCAAGHRRRPRRTPTRRTRPSCTPNSA
jgi:hypothetical protein